MPRPASSCKGIGLNEADYCASCSQPAAKQRCLRAAAAAPSCSSSSTAGAPAQESNSAVRSRKAPAAFEPAHFWSRQLPEQPKRMRVQQQRADERAVEAAAAQQKAAQQHEAQLQDARARAGFADGVLLSLSWYKFSSPAARSTECFIWEVGIAAASMQARVAAVSVRRVSVRIALGRPVLFESPHPSGGRPSN